jgi:phytoene dehydrogenase-like protein
MTPLTRREFVQGAALAPLGLASLGSLPQETAKAQADRFDVVVAGAGHNSLITAAYLAKAGYSVVVLEGRPVVGGGAKTSSATMVGFKDDTCSTGHTGIQDNPMLAELSLKDYGLEYLFPDPFFHMPFADGSSLTMWRDFDRTAAEFGKFSKKDEAAFRRIYAEMAVVRAALEANQFLPVGWGKPMNELLAGIPRLGLWQRRMAMSAWENICDNYEDEHTRNFLVTLALLGPLTDPQYPGTGMGAFGTATLMKWGRPCAKGGAGQLTQALARYIEAHNGVIAVNKPVTHLVIENGNCTGVECGDGSVFHADKAVLSTIHIKQLVNMAPRELWGQGFLDGVDTWKEEPGSIFAGNYALKEAPLYQGKMAATAALISSNPARVLLNGYDIGVGNANFDEPPMLAETLTVTDPSRAPAGMHTLKLMTCQPYSLKEGPEHWDEIKKEMAEKQLKYLRKFAPNMTDDKILGEFIQSPLDIERMNPAFWHGSVHAGAAGAAQTGAMRPMPGWAQHRMPIKGLYQTGSCTAPGGGVSGVPGRNAAMVMLKDFGTSIEQVVAKPDSKKG